MSTTEVCPTCGLETLDVPDKVRIRGGVGLMKHVEREPEGCCSCPEGEHFVAMCCDGCRMALRLGRGVMVW